MHSALKTTGGKKQKQKTLFQFSSIFLLGKSRPRVFMVLVFYYMLVTNTEKGKYYSWVCAFIRVELQTAFTRAHSAILQSRYFNLRVGPPLKIFLIHEANISKTDPVTLLF